MYRRKSPAGFGPLTEKRVFDSAARMLTRRDHSEKELRDKLRRQAKSRGQELSASMLDATIQRLHDLGFLKDPATLSQTWSASLGRKGLGHQRIAQELKKRGVPVPPKDSETEVTRCLELFEKRFGRLEMTDQKAKAKAFRYLTARGFDPETVRRVVLNTKYL